MSGVGISGLIEPLNGGSFPVFEDINGLGGFRTVASIAARNAIPANFRKIGMVAVTTDTGNSYKLTGGITNGDWAAYAVPGSSVISVFGRTGNVQSDVGDYDTGQIIDKSVVNFNGSQTTTNNRLFNTAQKMVASVGALAALDAGGFNDGLIAQIPGYDSFQLLFSPPAGTISDGVNIIDALNNAPAVWARLYTTPAANQYLADIWVDGAAGNDGSVTPDNAGTPLKTVQEAFNRIARLGLIVQNITIHYTGTGQSFDADLLAAIAVGSGITITLVGALTVLATQNITGFVAPNPTANTRAAVTFPAAGYAAREALLANATSSMAWVTALASANVDNTTNFVAADGSIHNPGGGASVSHVSFASSLGNVSARLPIGLQLIILNVSQTGAQSVQGPPLGLIFDQCLLSGGMIPSGPVAFVNCLTDGLDTVQNAGAPTISPGDPVLQHCASYGTLNFRGGQNVVLAGSTTVFSPGKLIVEDTTVQCEISTTADLSFWGLNSVDAPITLNDGARLDLQFCTVWGANGGVNTSFRMNPGSSVGVQSTNLPTITGGTALGFLGTRGFTAAQLPVVAPQLPGAFYFQDATNGSAGNTFDLKNQAANAGPTNLFAGLPTRGTYNVNCYVAMHGTGTAGNLVLNLTWTDPSGFIQTVAAVTITNIAASQKGAGAIVPIMVDGASMPTFSVTGVISAGGLSYDAQVVVEKKSSGA